MRSPLTIKIFLLSLVSIILASCGGGGGSSGDSSNAVDKKSPTVLLSQPADGAPVYGKQQPIRITFDEAIEMTSQNPVTVSTLNGDVVNGSTKIEDGKVLVFTPVSPLTEDTTYSLRVSDIKDLAGNLFNSGEFTVFFRATNQQDSASPYVVNTYPANGSLADVATTIRLEFNEKVQIGLSTVTVKNLANNQSVGILKKEISSDGRFMDIYLSETLLYLRNYSVEVANVYDLSGLRAQTVNFRFSTHSSINPTPPAVLSTTVQPNYISVKFSAPVKFKPSLTRKTVRSVALLSFTTDISPVDYPTSITGDGRELLIFPRDGAQFMPGNYALSLGGFLSGMNDQAVTATNILVMPSATQNGLTVKYLNKNTNQLGSNDSILLEFSTPVLRGLLSGSAENPDYVSLKKGSQQVPVNLKLSSNGRQLSIEPIGGLTFGQTYTVSLGAIKNATGEMLTPQTKDVIVVPLDTTPPSIKSTSPQNKATIAQGSSINVMFDEPVKGGNALLGSAESKANVKLLLNNSIEAATRMSLSDDGTVLKVEPLTLLPDQKYTLLVNGVYDVSGNRQSAALQIELTTVATTDNTNPSYLGANIVKNSEIKIYQPIELYFNESILPYNLGVGVVDANSTTADITWVQANNGQTLKIIPPTTGYALGKSYQLTVSGIKDLSGNPAPDVSLNFTTPSTPDTQAPAVVSKYPFDQNSTSVNTKEDYVIWFDEAIKIPSSASLITMATGSEQTVALELASDRALRVKSPVGGLQVNASYALVINGVTDFSNTPADSITIMFTAAPTTVSTVVRSDMLSQDPKLTIAVNEPYEVLFKEPIDESQLTTVSMTNMTNGQIIPISYDINELKNQLLIKTNGNWPTNQLRLNVVNVKSRLSGLQMNGISYKTNSVGPTLVGSLVVEFTTAAAVTPAWQNAADLTANSVNSLQAVFNTPVVTPLIGNVSVTLNGNTSTVTGIQAFLRSDRKTVDIILPNPTVSRQTYIVSNSSVAKLDGATTALSPLTFRVIDAVPTLNLFYHKAPFGNVPSNFRFTFELDEFSRINGSELLTLKAACTGTNPSASSCTAVPTSDNANFAYSWDQLAKISSSAWASTYRQDKPFNMNNSNQFSISLDNTDVLLNQGSRAFKITYPTDGLPTRPSFGNSSSPGRIYNHYLTTVPTNYGIDQIVMIGGIRYSKASSIANIVYEPISKDIYSSLDGGATWNNIGEIPSPNTFKGGVAGVRVNGQNYITAVIGNALKYATISSSAVGDWTDVLNLNLNSTTTSYRATVLPDNWSEPHVGRIVMVANGATGLEYVRMKSSSAINLGSNWETAISTINPGILSFSGFSVNLMLSVGVSSGLTNQPQTVLYLMGDDELLFLSKDAGATWSVKNGLLTVPTTAIPKYCHTNHSIYTPSNGSSITANRTNCDALSGSEAPEFASFNANGDLIADSNGNVVVFGLGEQDRRNNYYQFMLKNDSTSWINQASEFSFTSLHRKGGRAVRFRMGSENAILIVGGIPDHGGNTFYSDSGVEDLNPYVLRAFERDNYAKLGVPAVRKINLKTL